MGGSADQSEPAGVSRSLQPGSFSALLLEIAAAPRDRFGETWEHALTAGATVGRFELVQELGRGGFGVVWEARDRELGRRVALKAVRVGGREALREERLLHEAEAAARLAHPNIVTLFDVGHAELGPYLVMELLQGETLAKRLDRGPLAVPDAMRIAVEVAKGLAHAHGQGVVHRDLKPGNVFLCEDGQVKVLDLGMAHAFGRRRQDGGTPGYMAPEQSAGAPEDERADVFAMGVMLFEMLTGRLPFPDPKALASSSPAPLLEVSEAPALGELVGRMLAKEPLGRPRDGGSFQKELSAIRDAPARAGRGPAPVRVRRRLPRLALMGLLAAFVGAAVAVTLHLRKPVEAVPSPAADGRTTVAVADFANETSDRELDSLSGLLITSLEQSRKLRVLTRSRMFDLLREMGKGDASRIDEPLAREVGRKAGVAALFLPSVRRFGEDYVIEIRAIDPARDTYVFAVTERAHGKVGVWELVDRLSARARQALGEGAPAIRENRIDVGRAVTTSLEAYAHYFRAQQLEDGADRFPPTVIAEYEAAIRLDPEFALAQFAIAQWAQFWPIGDERLRVAMDVATRAASRLPEKERLMVEAWAAHLDGRQEEAHTIYARAVETYPQDKQVLYRAGDLFHHEGRPSEAAELFSRALAVDPTWAEPAYHLVQNLDELGRPGEGVAVAERVVKANPGAFGVLVLAKQVAGDFAGAIQVLERRTALGDPSAIQLLPGAYMLAGRGAEAEELVGRLEEASTEPDRKVRVLAQRAQLAAHRGRIREAIALAESGAAVPGAAPTWVMEGLPISMACASPAAVGRVAPLVESLLRRRQPTAYNLPALLAYAGDAGRAARLAALLPRGIRGYEVVRTWRAGDRDAALKLLPRERRMALFASLLAGEILLEQGRPAEAAAALRVVQRWGGITWKLSGAAPVWIVPRSRALLARALADLGDRDGARAELDAFFAALDRPDPDLPLLAESKALCRRLGCRLPTPPTPP